MQTAAKLDKTGYARVKVHGVIRADGRPGNDIVQVSPRNLKIALL